MDKSPDAFRSIGEVSRLVGVAPHVLRYWESQFSQLSPVKRGDGRRYYRPDDVRLVAGLCQVLREEGLSIRGAKRLIAADRGSGLRQIGALRLGESMGEQWADQRRAPAITPAVRLAVPVHLSGAEAGAMMAPAPGTGAVDGMPTDRVDVSRAAANRRKPADQSLPLFPELDGAARQLDGAGPPVAAAAWLTRLAATAAMLRHHERARTPLPAQAETLRLALVQDR